MDQLMDFAWKFMLPLGLINILVTGVWRFMQPAWPRWLVSLL
jgi:NADH-quinone oxidoreductase subunit H